MEQFFLPRVYQNGLTKDAFRGHSWCPVTSRIAVQQAIAINAVMCLLVISDAWYNLFALFGQAPGEPFLPTTVLFPLASPSATYVARQAAEN